MFKKWLLVSACLGLAHMASADTVRGVVLDSEGRGIADATVQVVGTSRKVVTDSEGRFALEDLPNADLELHVSSRAFMHTNVHIHGTDDNVQVLMRGSVIEVIDVTALPWHVSQMESAAPVTVLSGDKLRSKQSSTLGATLNREVGVHSSYNGPAAATPIIRGLSGPRVMVAQNGLDVGDASRIGPDHSVASEATTARQIEILRGPATLFYGSGAIGGVVNVVDDRIPRDAETFGAGQIEYNSANREPVVQGSINTGAGDFAVHADAFWREAEDLRIPRSDHHHDDHESNGILEGSAYDSQGLTLGGSYLMPEGFAGLSIGRLERNYGIPGHSHGDEFVHAELEQDRLQLVSEYQLHNAFLSEVRARYGYTDYQHQEIEGGMALTTFANTLHEARADIFHHPWREWRGAVSLHYRNQDFSAVGEEAFTPASTTESLAIALMEERHFGDVLLQLGARAEHVTISADDVLLSGDSSRGIYSIDHEFTPFSLSAGVVWDFTPGYNLGVSLSRSQRAPSSAELLSNGPHLGSGSYEIGALYDVVANDHGDWVVNFSRAPMELETANNIDISLRKFEGDLGFVVGAFYNRFDDFYYQRATDLVGEFHHDHGDEHDDHGHDSHDHGHDDHGHDDHSEDSLPVFIFTAADMKTYGLEGELHWKFAQPLTFIVRGDYTRMQLRDGGDLPRVPPLRLGAELNYDQGPLTASINATRYFSQSRIAEFETETAGYTWVSAEVAYRFGGTATTTVFLRGDNLANEEARVHSSFIKDIAPLPARSLSLGLRSRF
ncbi:MAG TPA: TonB-dependent receptor [Cellvibrionaceae bacterium]